MANIQERAMLVRLTVKLWTARRVDDDATRIVVEEKKAEHTAGEFGKNLLPVPEWKNLRKAIGQARATFKNQTLPWEEAGRRMLPATNHLQFSQEMRKAVAKVNQIKTDIKKNWPDILKRSKKALGGMFDETEYPQADEMDELVKVEWKIDGVPDPKDFRVNLPQVDVEKIRQEIEERVNEQVMIGQKDVWVRLKDAVSHLTEKLGEKDGIFRDTLVGNVKEMVKVLPKLNITGDKEFDKICKDVEKMIAGVEPEDLRKDEKKRTETAEKAKKLMDKMGGYMGLQSI